MKKTMSILLAAVMLLAFLPAVFATPITDINFDEDYTFSNSDELLSGYDYTVNPGKTVTVPAGVTLYIPENGSLTISRNATLEVAGSIVVMETGRLTVNGAITGDASKITGAGTREVEIRFPSLSSAGWASTDLEIWWAYSESGNANENQINGFTFTKVPAAGKNVYCPLNTYIYVKADITRDGALSEIKYDDNLLGVTMNGIDMPIRAEQVHFTKIKTSGTVAYSSWTNEDDYLKTYKISLTSGTGYTVIGQDGEYETAYVKYGLPFSFKVEIDENYSMVEDTLEVYIYNGYGVVNYNPAPGTTVTPTQPDAAGNYTIPFVNSDYTVYVSMLPMDDDMTTKVGGILQTIRTVFEMIINFFRQIVNAFNIGG